MHTLLFPDLGPVDSLILVEDEEAHHAIRSKRVRAGERVRVMTGRGAIAECDVVRARQALELRILSVREFEPVRPQVHVWSATPKGPRVDALVDALVQTGAASWTPMTTRWSVVDPRQTKLQRLQRIALEAAKQSLRPWLMDLGEKSTFQDAIAPEPARLLLLADARGRCINETAKSMPSARPESIRLLIGPEGGWTEEEREAATGAGAVVCSLGPHTMRIEIAAPLGVGLVLAAFGAGECNPRPAWPQEPKP